MSITVENLTKVYGTQVAVDELSFSLLPGQIIGFLGPNGAGKSTTMKMIAGFLNPTSGTAFIDGLSVLKHPIETKKQIGYLPESNALYYDMYVKEYLGFVASLYKVTNKAKKIADTIEKVKLEKEQTKKIGELSKGYKQRVGLAAAFIHNPQVLILDEPTSGLDPNQIIEIRELIKELGKNKTVLFSTHILQEVEALCQRVIIINKGIKVADEELNKLNLKHNSRAVIFTFKEAVTESFFEKTPFAKSIHMKTPTQYNIETENPDLLKKEIMKKALENNLTLLSIKDDTLPLEKIFSELTSASDGFPIS